MIAWAAPAVAIAAILAGLVAFQRLQPRPALGVLLIALAVALAVYRMIAIAGPLALVGIALLQQGGRQRAKPAPGKVSQVQTGALSMSLDHDTGDMDGDVLAGPFSGARLSDLGSDDLQELYAWLESEGDDTSLSLLLAFLERHGTGETQAGAAPLNPQGEMTEAEAYNILGLEPGASTEEVREAHKRLIRKVHPDLGGSGVLASMINAAKEKLDPD